MNPPERFRPHRRNLFAIATVVVLLSGLVHRSGTAQSVQAPSPSTANLPSANLLSLGATPPRINFDVILFKPCAPGKWGTTKVDMPMDSDYLAYHCEAMSRLIYFAYWGAFQPYSLAHTYPNWVDDEAWEFVAKVAPDNLGAWQKLDLPGRRLVMRTILAEQVKLKVGLLSTPESVYALAVSKHGTKLKPYKDGDQTKIPDGRTQTGRSANWVGSIAYFQNFTMTELAELLTSHFDRRIVDRTGLSGPYSFSMPVPFGGSNDPFAHFPTDDGPSTAEGLEDLGLHLESTTTPVDRLQIVGIERPEKN